jgi:hypothetical protein
MKTFVLLVTWIVSGQPPSSYQTIFNSAETCEAARNAVLADGQRLKAEYMAAAPQQLAAMWSLAAPKVSAVCAAQ